MALTAGTKVGSYEIVTAIGAGGMGEVYKARDTRLRRDVAIKVLPDLFATDAERLARFEREAQVLASLNHPNIAIIHGFEESDGISALVLELVEGPTLADRIAQGAIPLDEALRIARQIAEALSAAHEHGIIHRDLKPSNIKLRPDGMVKVLDFGLAKALDPSPTSTDVSRSPTITSPAATRMGVILGTAGYMSPEQARGKSVDKRADIWAFGCVLYEMLTGRHAFAGDDVTDTLAFIITREPDWMLLPASTGVPVRRLLRRCLQKDLKHRLADIADARLEIEEAQSGSAVDGSMAAPSAPPTRERIAWISAVAILALMAVGAMVWAFRPAPLLPEMRLEITTPATTDPTSLAISPDGKKIVFVATSDGRSRLWLRPLDSAWARPLAGTEDAASPFWSPDSRSVGFFSENTLKRIDIEGRSVQALARTGGGRGGAWNQHGTILYTPAISGRILRIPATGGDPTQVTRLDAPHQAAHRFPQFLPDGRHFLYYVRGSPEARGVYIGQIDGSETRRLLDADAAAVYASSGHLLFIRQGTLFAQSFDPAERLLTGDPVAVVDQLASDWQGAVALSVSTAGSVIYRTGSLRRRQLVWFDRSGKAIEKVGESEFAGLITSSLSTDGTRVAMHRDVDGNLDIWLLETRRNVLRRLTFDPSNEIFPIWSPDGSRLVFSSNRKGVYDLYEMSAASTAGEKPLLVTAEPKTVLDWSPDGRFLLYMQVDAKTRRDLWALPLDGDRRPFPLLQTNFDESFGQFSPDGEWIAFESNESGRKEVYVQPFPGPGGKVPISTGGGESVRWPREGKELFYIAPDERLMAVPIRLPSDDRPLDAGTPVALFATQVGGLGQSGADQLYMVSADGQRFLMNTVLEGTSTSPIRVILNWKVKP